MLIYLDQIADKKLKAPSTEDATTNVYASSTASIRTAGGMSIEKRLMVGQFYGRVPLGGVIPVVSTFTASNNGGGSPSDLSLLTPASGSVSADGFMRCDGVEITDPLSPFIGRYVPNISDDRFIQGSNSSSTLSVVYGANNGNNTVTLTVPEMPSHNHNFSDPGHIHDLHDITSGNIGDKNFGISVNGVSENNFRGTGLIPDTGEGGQSARQGKDGFLIRARVNTTGISFSGQGGGASFDIRPKYISGIYLMRVI